MIKYILIALLFAAPVYASHSNQIIIQHETSDMSTFHHREKSISKFQEDSIRIIKGVTFVRVDHYSVTVAKGKAFDWKEINGKVVEILNIECENCHEVKQ